MAHNTIMFMGIKIVNESPDWITIEPVGTQLTIRATDKAAEDAARLEQMRDWLKAEGESNYEKWAQPTQELIPTVGDLARMGRCDGTNAFIAKASRKMFDLWPELFPGVGVIDLSSQGVTPSQPLLINCSKCGKAVVVEVPKDAATRVWDICPDCSSSAGRREETEGR